MTFPNAAKTALIFLDWKIGNIPIRIPQGAIGAGEPPAFCSFDATSFQGSWDAANKVYKLSFAGGFSPGSLLLAPSGSGLTVNGTDSAGLTGNITFQVEIDTLSLSIVSNKVGTLYPLSVTPDPGTIGVRTFTGDAGPAAIHGQGALLAERLVAGGSDDSPARTGLFAAPKLTLGLSFRNNADSGDVRGVSHEYGPDGNTVVVGRAGGAQQLDLRAASRVAVALSVDDATVEHSRLTVYHDDTPSGPTVAYSADIGVAAVHIFPAGGSFEIWEDGTPALLRAKIDQGGIQGTIHSTECTIRYSDLSGLANGVTSFAKLFDVNLAGASFAGAKVVRSSFVPFASIAPATASLLIGDAIDGFEYAAAAAGSMSLSAGDFTATHILGWDITDGFPTLTISSPSDLNLLIAGHAVVRMLWFIDS